MTVIAWDGKTLAADKLACDSGNRRTITKIKRVGSKLCGSAGPSAIGLEMMAWVEGGCDPEQFPEAQRDNDRRCTFLVIEDGRKFVYENSPHPVEFEDDQVAIGCGRDFAMAAMHLGKTAVEAVTVACHFDTNCGNGVDVLTLA